MPENNKEELEKLMVSFYYDILRGFLFPFQLPSKEEALKRVRDFLKNPLN